MDQFSHEPPLDPADEDVAAARLGARDSLLLAAHLRLGDDSSLHQVRIRNLSSGGLMVEYVDHVAVGTSADVEVRNIGWVKGRVAWATEGRIGIAFDHEIDPMAARKPVGTGRKTPHFVKPVLPRR